MKKGKVWFQHSLKSGAFWCSYKYFWSNFEKEFGLTYKGIQLLIQRMVIKHLKLNLTTPHNQYSDLFRDAEKFFRSKRIAQWRIFVALRVCREHFKDIIDTIVLNSI